jgi:hypothetical protein
MLTLWPRVRSVYPRHAFEVTERSERRIVGDRLVTARRPPRRSERLSQGLL